MFVGIDVSASRGLDLCVLDERRRVTLLVKARDRAALDPVLRGLPRTATIAIDAPARPALGLLPGKDHRVCEAELARLGITLYFTPSSEAAAPGWMREGFELYRLVEGLGFPLYRHGDAGAGVTVEVYPHLSYVSLTGTRRGAASKLEWSRAALRGRVSGLPPSAEQDALDAACAALTAWHFVHGRWVAYGDPSEGVIVGPQPKGDLWRAEAAAPDQLALPFAGTAPPRVVRAPRASSFADRVAALAAQIPAGKVATYSDIARWAGKPAGARAVGTILKARAFELPCHRVVDAAGRPPPFPEDSAERLRAEGVAMNGRTVALGAARWRGPA